MPNNSMLHWFDGAPKLSVWTFNGGSAAFSARFLPTKWLNDSRAAGQWHPVKSLMGAEPAWPSGDLLDGLLEPVGSQGINTWQFKSVGGDAPPVLTALTDAAFLKTLTVEAGQDGGHLAGAHSTPLEDDIPVTEMLSCAHPAAIPGSAGVSVNFFSDMSVSGALGANATFTNMAAVVVPGSAPGSLKRLPFARWNSSVSRYTHSFGMAAHHVSMLFPPVEWDMEDLMWKLDLLSAMRWTPTAGMHLVIAPLPTLAAVPTDGPVFRVQASDTPPFFNLHAVNAWEEACSVSDAATLGVAQAACSRVVSEYESYASVGILTAFTMAHLGNATFMDTFQPGVSFRRISMAVPTGPGAGQGTVDLPASLLEVSELSWVWEEGMALPAPVLPRFNRAWAGRRTCFIWGMAAHVRGSGSYVDMGVVKVDTCAGTGGVSGTDPISASFTPGLMMSEPVFVPRPGAEEEDDGAVVVDAWDPDTSTSFLFLLDAATLEVLAKLQAPIPIPMPVHGEWYPGGL